MSSKDTSQIIVAIHQPNFLPWLGFFHKLACAHIFVLLDNVPYTKNGYQNRVKIKSAQGGKWLTVPVLTKGRFGQLTHDVQINQRCRWIKTHLATLHTNYNRAPYYHEVMAWLEPLYDKPNEHLARFNQSLIKAMLYYLKLPNKLVSASSLIPESNGSEHLLELVQAVSGSIYLSGPSGRDYLETSIFQDEGIRITFQQFQRPVYSQLYGEFIPGLSILDLLMNVSPTEALELLREGPTVEQVLEGEGIVEPML